MKKLLILLTLTLTVASAYGQLGRKVGRTPAISNDWRNGFINITEFNGGLGLGLTDKTYSKNYFGITTVNGYQFSRNIKAGIGIGLQFHNGGMLIPAYIDGRFNFSSQEIVPFFALAGGVALSPENINNQTRVFINPSFGVRYIAMPKLSITLSIGMMTQAGGLEARSSFICFKFGTEFKGKKMD
jgi:hypothetical protein